MKNSLTLKLKSGEEIPVYNCSLVEPYMVAYYDNWNDISAYRETIQSGNLSEIYIQKKGNTLLTFEDCVLDGIQTFFNMDGTFTVNFYFREHAHNISEEKIITLLDEEEEEEEPEEEPEEN